MSTLATPRTPDPAIETPAHRSVEEDYPAHVHTYNRFLNLVKWFAIHLLLLTVGLYFLVMAANPVAGSMFILIAVAALVYGIVRNPNARQDVTSAVTEEKASA